MHIETHEGLPDLAAYATISIEFWVERILALVPGADPTDPQFVERVQDPPYHKDYDASPGGRPTNWPRRFDTSAWGMISAWSAGARVGGAVLVQESKDVDMLEGRQDLAVLWDIRVEPTVRRAGVGSALLAASELWASARGCKQLKVETQNVNLPACRFYESHGFELGAVNPSAYPELPSEIQMLWYKTVTPGRSGAGLPTILKQSQVL